ncbi:glycosyltransferase family 4 protein [Thermococcus sp. AM4]|uniref:glycosyltransferase family 4 protein n=1 Tax=Thermococcus sp. (strain AM4) TaxID=246969 RepID=UPI00018710E9|nr:glycosyltransferase family 4 protein [Thermococcus sp. AM4]EEB73800.1 glycosyltransferase [Thermococcus sp. AM4]
MKRITIIYPWGDPLKEGSGSSARTKGIIRLLVNLSKEFNVTIEGVGIKSYSNGPIVQLGCIPGKFGLLLDFNPWYFLRRVQKREDVLIISGPLGIFGALVGRFLSRKLIKIVYDAHNVEKERMKLGAFSTKTSLLRIITRIILTISEFLAVKYADCIIAISHRDKRLFREEYGAPLERIRVVYPAIEPVPLSPERHSGVLFHGSFKYVPNREALEALLKISEKLPWVEFYIAGSGMFKGKMDNVMFLGFVENLNEFFKLGDLAVAPLKRGAGVKLKIVDYLSRGIPVVTTSIGAQGLELTNEKNAVVVDDLEEMARRVEFLFENPKYKRKIGLLGRRHVERLLSREQAGKNLMDCIRWEKELI